MANFSISGTLVANTNQEVVLTPRWSYITVENTGTTVIYLRTDGVAASVGGNECYSLMPNERGLFSNQLPLWTQAASVIPAGDDLSAHPPTVPGTPGFPGTPASPTVAGGSLYGGTANPTTKVDLISTGTPTFTVSAAG